MVIRRRGPAAVLALLALGVGSWSWFRATGARTLPRLALGASELRSGESALPRIGLVRLKHEEAGAESHTGAARDLFQFGRAPAPAEAPRPQPVATPPSAPVDPGPVAPPPPPTLPSLGVKFVGSVEQQGTRVAVLLTDDKKEVLTGREGDTVANRLKIVKIGFESVDVQDVGSDRIRRIPLRGN